MKYFTNENTEGYTDEQWKRLNDQYCGHSLVGHLYVNEQLRRLNDQFDLYVEKNNVDVTDEQELKTAKNDFFENVAIYA